MQNLKLLSQTFSFKRQLTPIFLLIAFLSFANYSFAQASPEYPNKPIKLIIPFPAGGSSDGIGRQVADKLSGVLK